MKAIPPHSSVNENNLVFGLTFGIWDNSVPLVRPYDILICSCYFHLQLCQWKLSCLWKRNLMFAVLFFVSNVHIYIKYLFVLPFEVGEEGMRCSPWKWGFLCLYFFAPQRKQSWPGEGIWRVLPVVSRGVRLDIRRIFFPKGGWALEKLPRELSQPQTLLSSNRNIPALCPHQILTTTPHLLWRKCPQPHPNPPHQPRISMNFLCEKPCKEEDKGRGRLSG